MSFVAFEENEPQTYKAALRSPDSDKWKVAINEELNALDRNNTWTVVDRPPGRKIVDCRWVFRIKKAADRSIERYKARLVAKGFTQVPGTDFDETFSPVVRYDSLRLLIALTAAKNWKPQQCDIKSAFLYGELKEEIYMYLPEGSRIDGKVCRLKKSLYGLKQSPREWHARLTSFLLPYDFKPTAFDPCVLIHSTKELFIAIYVDDLSLFGATGKLMDSTKDLLKSELQVTDLGDLH